MTRSGLVIISGNGWSGSSALVHLLEIPTKKEYTLIPGEFDDFRAPGTMRDALNHGRKPVSHRAPKKVRMLQYLVRGICPNFLWPKFLPGQNISQKEALVSFFSYRKELSLMNAFGQKIIKQNKKAERKTSLRQWINEVCKIYQSSNNNSKVTFIEQFIHFDDKYENYDWLEIEKLILFIRQPRYQLAATLESDILYDEYPWQAEFVIGTEGNSLERKLELFLDTTVQRYDWILSFLKNMERRQILVIDFDEFLVNLPNVINEIEADLGISLRENLKEFDINASRKRNVAWDGSNKNINEKIVHAENAYSSFKKNIQKNYKLIG